MVKGFIELEMSAKCSRTFLKHSAAKLCAAATNGIISGHIVLWLVPHY